MFSSKRALLVRQPSSSQFFNMSSSILTLLVLFLFASLVVSLKQPLIYRIHSTKPTVARKYLDEFLDTLSSKDLDDDLEIVSSDSSHIYLSAMPRVAPSVILASESDDERSPLTERSSLFHLNQFLFNGNFPVKILPKISYVGRVGKIEPSVLPHFHHFLNGRVPKGYTQPKKMRKFLPEYDCINWANQIRNGG